MIASLEAELNTTSDWPEASPLAFVGFLAPGTKGKLSKTLVARLAESCGRSVERATTDDFDLQIGQTRIQVKFSTEQNPRFQQVRDPRLSPDETKYDYLICVSGRPEQFIYWAIDAEALGNLMDNGHIVVQHAMSDTKWFWPSRHNEDEFSDHRLNSSQFIALIESLS